MRSITNAAGIAFGLMFTGLAVLVSAETILRKLFNISLQGTDELGGYILAIGSSLAFSVALLHRAHIRIDILHQRLPAAVQAVLNWASIVLLAALGLFFAYVCWTILAETLEYGSTAPTPWATPLIYPQSLWYAGLVIFALLAVALAARATVLLLQGRVGTLNNDFGPQTADDELKEELEDIKQR